MLAAIPTESKESNIKIEIQEQMVPSAGFSPQSDPYNWDYMQKLSEQSFGIAQGLNTPRPTEATSAYFNLADTFDLSLLGDDHDMDMATVPSPSWSPAFSMEPPSWQQVSFYAASPNEGNGYDIKPAMSPEGLYTSNFIYNPASPATSINSQASMDSTENKNMLLRQCLADTSFQKKYNFKPLDLPPSSLFVEPSSLRKDLPPACENTTLELNQIEPVFSMAFEQFRTDIQSTCSSLAISPDPSQWSGQDVQKWLSYIVVAFLPANNVDINKVLGKFWTFDGPTLCALTEEAFKLHEPDCGYMIFHQLELWKMLRTKTCGEAQITPAVNFPTTTDFDFEQIFSSPHAPSPLQPTTVAENFEEPPSVVSDAVPTMVSSPSSSYSSPAETELMTTDEVDEDDDEEEEKPLGKGKNGQKNGAHIHLWQFLKELLATPQQHGSCIRWLDQPRGVFKIEDSVKVARLWGLRKNRPAMNYDKLSRSIRQYYRKGIMKKTERSQRLVYQFCHPYGLQ